MNKRVRASNWEEDEKNLLRSLILEKIDIIENKNVAATVNAAKRVAWREILTKFNDVNKSERDLKQLKIQWRNTKGLVKSQHAEFRNVGDSPGGYTPSAHSPENVIIKVSPRVDYPEDSNGWDSDNFSDKETTDLNEENESQKPNRRKRKIYAKKEEYEIYLLNKKIKEQALAHAEEEHAHNLEILQLQKEYWKRKIDLLN